MNPNERERQENRTHQSASGVTSISEPLRSHPETEPSRPCPRCGYELEVIYNSKTPILVRCKRCGYNKAWHKYKGVN